MREMSSKQLYPFLLPRNSAKGPPKSNANGTHIRHIFLEVTVKNASMDQSHQNKSRLVSDRFPPILTVKLAVCLQQELVFLGQLYSDRLTGMLVGFHGSIPATFVPILENLQQIQREGDLAFRKWVLLGYNGHKDGDNIPPPAYARKPGFIFPPASITNLIVDNVPLDPSTPESVDTLKLQTQTGLDCGQCQGLVAALTREYALTQGPPGTGKSYLGVKIVQALLEIKKKAKLNAIIVICYTNHALDQFLKHLLDATELEGKNLRVVGKGIGKTGVESKTLGMSYKGVEDCLSWATMGNFVRHKWPIIHDQLERLDPEGFTTVTDDKLLKWLRVKSMTIRKGQNESQVDGVRLEGLTRAAKEDIHSLSIPERHVLAIDWFKQWRESETASLFDAIDRAASLRDDINAVHEEFNRRALIQADVVGITTTSFARHIKTLRRIGTKVIICEEAAEVMEALRISDACGDKSDSRVDFLEWKTYSEINLDETPIIVLGCGHFFTSESADGLVGLDEVYTRDKDGKFEGLRDVSSSLARAIPLCPDCKQPIRQFVTKRCNRVINRAVMDETYKRFLSKGRIDLEGLELRLNDIEDKLNSKGALLLGWNAQLQFKALFTDCERLGTEASTLSKTMEAENQPMKRLMNVITICQKPQTDEIASLSARMEAINLATREPDNQITLGARLIHI
ncbi:hypothetical protein N7463_001271 [Penicillium fimorum]|uniref:DNA2/NAM7 helicase helicase domain-containing protein n=1 Tax=Penicillium fimorum TaxID=1882269 RepID=A0A9W9Y6S6_9EURO|nr:hypothetical protein N7463_001271 [Penicillium fimorum]